jgi:hypothetical protein
MVGGKLDGVLRSGRGSGFWGSEEIPIGSSDTDAVTPAGDVGPY